jgi:hypothetical protein
MRIIMLANYLVLDPAFYGDARTTRGGISRNQPRSLEDPAGFGASLIGRIRVARCSAGEGASQTRFIADRPDARATRCGIGIGRNPPGPQRRAGMKLLRERPEHAIRPASTHRVQPCSRALPFRLRALQGLRCAAADCCAFESAWNSESWSGT